MLFRIYCRGGLLRTYSRKIEAIRAIPSPKSVKEVRSFFLNFSNLTAPLSDLIKKDLNLN